MRMDPLPQRARKKLLLLASVSLVALGVAASPLSLDGPTGFGLKAAYADSCCFRAGTRVLMADGGERPIESLRPGDRVRGRDGRINTVLGVERTRLGRRRLWSINGSRPFVTAEHPFLGPDGWYAIDPKATACENPALSVRPLARGVRLIRLVARTNTLSNGAAALEAAVTLIEETVEITSLIAVVYDEDTPLYNLRLDGDHTYVADGWLVHNKGGGDSSGDDDDDDDGPSDGPGTGGNSNDSDDDDSNSGSDSDSEDDSDSGSDDDGDDDTDSSDLDDAADASDEDDEDDDVAEGDDDSAADDEDTITDLAAAARNAPSADEHTQGKVLSAREERDAIAGGWR